MAYEAFPKAILYLATLLAVGLAAARSILLPAATRDWARADRRAVDRTLYQLGIVAAATIILALAARAVGHTIVVFGPQDLTWVNLETIALESRWGDSWRRQLWAAMALLAAAIFSVRSTSLVQALSVATAVGLTLTIPLLGHAAESAFGHALHTIHLLGSGIWLGGLAVVTTLLLNGQSDAGRSIGLVRQFSPMALSGASLTAITGAIATALYVGSPDNLATPYGRALTLKLMTFAGVVWCGRANWKRVRSGSAPRVGMMLVELILAVGIVLVTSVLTELEHP